MNWDAATDRMIVNEFVAEVMNPSMEDRDYFDMVKDLTRRGIDSAAIIKDCEDFMEEMKTKYSTKYKRMQK